MKITKRYPQSLALSSWVTRKYELEGIFCTNNTKAQERLLLRHGIELSVNP